MENIKTIFKSFLFYFLIFVLPSCKNTVSPESNIAINKGEYSGTFSVTYKNYKNYSSAVTQSGSISIFFNDSTYEYSAIADYSSDTLASDSLGDSGRYSINQGNIVMDDFCWLRMDDIWHNSLYFEGTFSIHKIDNILQIVQDNSFAKWNLNLVFK